MLGKPYSDEELSRIRSLHLQGLNLHEIAEQLKRSDSSIFNRAKAMGLDTKCNSNRCVNAKKAWQTRREKYGSTCFSKEGYERRRNISRLFFLSERNPSHRKDVREKISLAQKGVPCPQRGRKGKVIPLSQRKRLSEFAKQRFANPQNHPLFGKPRSEQSKEKQRKAMLGRKQSLELIERRIKASMKAQHKHPNRPEKKLAKLLEGTFPNEYRYVGDGSFIIGGKCPDFVNVNGKKKIIEVFGIYWHEKFEEPQRINLYKQFGFDTLIVWETELDNIPLLSNKLVEFHNGVQV